jgi:hypothetical protein
MVYHKLFGWPIMYNSSRGVIQVFWDKSTQLRASGIDCRAEFFLNHMGQGKHTLTRKVHSNMPMIKFGRRVSKTIILLAVK